MIACLGSIGGAIALITLPALIGIYANCDAYISGCGTFHSTALGSIGDLISAVALFAAALGGYRLYKGDERARTLVCVAIPVIVLADILSGIGFGVYFGLLVHAVGGAVLWYLVVMAETPARLPVGGVAAYPLSAPPVSPPAAPLATAAPDLPSAPLGSPVAMPPIPPTAPPLPQAPPSSGPPVLPPQA